MALMMEASGFELNPQEIAHFLVESSSLPSGVDGTLNAAGYRHSPLVFCCFFVVVVVFDCLIV